MEVKTPYVSFEEINVIVPSSEENDYMYPLCIIFTVVH